MTGARRIAALLLCAGGALAVDAPAQTAAPRWRLTASAEGGFDTNPKILPDDEPIESSQAARLSALVERNWNLPRTRLLLRGDATRQSYRGAPELSRNTWGVESQGTYAFSSRVSIGLDAAERRDASRDLRSLTDTGFVLGQILTHTRRGRFDMTWRAAEHVTAVFESRYERYSFDSDDFVGGSTLGGGARLDITPWPRTSLVLSADVQRQRREDRPDEAPVSDGETRAFSGTVTRGVPEHVQASFTVGLTSLVPLGATQARPTALLAAGLRARRGRHTLDLRGDRRVSEAFGLGRSALTLGFTASDSLALTQRWALSVRANWSRTTDPADATFELRSWGATGELSWRAGPRLRARGAYAFYRGEDRGTTPRTNQVLTVNLAYERNWR